MDADWWYILSGIAALWEQLPLPDQKVLLCAQVHYSPLSQRRIGTGLGKQGSHDSILLQGVFAVSFSRNENKGGNTLRLSRSLMENYIQKTTALVVDCVYIALVQKMFCL